MFAIVLCRGMRIAHAEADAFGSLLGVGLSSLFGIQVLINIAVDVCYSLLDPRVRHE